MIVFDNLSSPPPLPLPIALTIGMFDGVHVGHKHLLSTVAELGATSLAITFSNHPLEVLTGSYVPLLLPLAQKLDRLSQTPLTACLLLPFTAELAQTPYDIFLRNVHAHIPFSHLVLGEGDRIGKDRAGDALHLTQLGALLGFTAHFLPKKLYKGEPISSSRIRNALHHQHTQDAEAMLGYPLPKEYYVNK